jgi:O-methyltransferase involved in polyketide biosynthesis
MLMPLWGRANFSRLYPQFIRDREAENIIDGLSYDFTNMSQALGEYGGIAYLVRARRFDDAIRDYIRLHPRATVVNLGSGLDTTFSRVDNGSIRWFNLDLPDSIAFRKKLIPDKERSTCIQRSAFDLKWLDEVAFEPEKGLFIIAGGLFMYFKTHQVRNLFEAISHRFQGGELYFDTLSWLGRGYVNVMLKKAGTPQMHFYVSNSRRLFSTWSTKIEVVEDIPLWYGVKRDPRWSKRTRLMMDLCDLLKTGKYIRLKFLR